MILNEYETTCIVQPELTDDGLTRITERLVAIIGSFSGSVLTFEDWGARKLAFPLKKHARGRYLYWRYVALAPCIAELERIIRIDNEIIRYLTVNLGTDVDVEERRAAAAQMKPRRVDDFDDSLMGGDDRPSRRSDDDDDDDDE